MRRNRRKDKRKSRGIRLARSVHVGRGSLALRPMPLSLPWRRECWARASVPRTGTRLKIPAPCLRLSIRTCLPSDEKRLVLGLSDPTGDFLCRRRAESLAVFRVIPLVFHDLASQCFAYSHGKLILGPLRQRAIYTIIAQRGNIGQISNGESKNV